MDDELSLAPSASGQEPAGEFTETSSSLEGYLHKRGDKGLGVKFGVKDWKKRWFVLHIADNLSGRVFYYKTHSSDKAIGAIDLSVATSVQRTDASSDSKRGPEGWAFQINTPSRIWYLMADTESQMEHWVERLRTVMQTSRDLVNTVDTLRSQVAYLTDQNDELRVENDQLRSRLGLEPSSRPLLGTKKRTCLQTWFPCF